MENKTSHKQRHQLFERYGYHAVFQDCVANCQQPQNITPTMDILEKYGYKRQEPIVLCPAQAEIMEKFVLLQEIFDKEYKKWDSTTTRITLMRLANAMAVS
jgi:hypothetical protein